MMKKLLTVLVILILTPVFLILILYLGLAWYYSDTYFSGIVINGIYAAGMTPKEVDALLLAQTEEASFIMTDKYGKTFDIPLKDMEFSYDYMEELQSIKNRQNPLLWGMILVEGTNRQYEITPKGVCDTAALKDYLLSLELLKNQADPDKLRVEIVREKDGYVLVDESKNLLDAQKAVDAVVASVLNGERRLDLEEAGCYIEFTYTNQMKKTLAMWEKVKRLQSAQILCRFYDADVTVDAPVICDWISVDDRGNFLTDDTGRLLLDEEKVAAYVEKLAKEHDSTGGPWNFKPTRGGVVTIEKGTYGYKLDQKKQTEYFMENVYAGSRVESEAIYSQKGWGDATGDIGATYIEVDMGNQMMYYYVDHVLQLSTPVVTGNTSKGNGTPARVCYIYYKQRNRVLIGEDYRTPVSYWMAVYGNIGIHDASWRGKFGGSIYKTNGSHGCINTPTKAVSQLYEMAPEGTPVVMFY